MANLNYIFTILFFIPILEAAISKNTTCIADCCGSLKARSKPMTYFFYQSTGKFVGGEGQWAINTKTYSGSGKGLLNPSMQCVKNTGPLPATTYQIVRCTNIMHSTKTRPCSFELRPLDASAMCGRSQFFVHGCDVCGKGDDTVPPAPGCSAGCIVMNHSNRKKLRIKDKIIVYATEPTKKPI